MKELAKLRELLKEGWRLEAIAPHHGGHYLYDFGPAVLKLLDGKESVQEGFILERPETRRKGKR